MVGLAIGSGVKVNVGVGNGGSVGKDVGGAASGADFEPVFDCKDIEPDPVVRADGAT